jgi:hypothetical protein
VLRMQRLCGGEIKICIKRGRADIVDGYS